MNTRALLALVPNLTLRAVERRPSGLTGLTSLTVPTSLPTYEVSVMGPTPPPLFPRPDSLSMSLARGVSRVVHVTPPRWYVLRLASGHSHRTMKRCVRAREVTKVTKLVTPLGVECHLMHRRVAQRGLPKAATSPSPRALDASTSSHTSFSWSLRRTGRTGLAH